MRFSDKSVQSTYCEGPKNAQRGLFLSFEINYYFQTKALCRAATHFSHNTLHWNNSVVQCTLGCSDFDFFVTFWGITTHPWHPKGPRIWKLAKKIFQLHPWPVEIFGKNRKMRFFGIVSKFNFRGPVWQIFTIFSACFIYGILNTRTKI